MKSKFLGTMIAIAVVLSMVMVPAMPGVALAQTPAGVEVVPSLTKVGFAQDFDLEIWGMAPGAQTWDTGDVHLDFNNAYMQVNFITNGALPLLLGSAWNNATGTIDHTAGILGQVTGNQLICTVNCTSLGVTGISTIDFVNVPPLRVTDIIDGGVSRLNWALVVNGTLKVGSPALTVDVSPAGKGDVDIIGLSIPSSYPNVSYWTWDQGVQLQAVNSVAGWVFDSWSGDLTGSASPDTVTMTDAKSVTANFVELPCDLDVDPNTINLEARFGANEDSGTVTITNDGGGLLCWALGYPPSWSVGDTWTFMNSYSEYPPANPFPSPWFVPGLPCTVNDTLLDITVVGETNCTYIAVADWPLTDPQRSIKGGIPACLQDAVVVVDKCSLDYVSQLANLTIYMGPPPGLPSSAWVTWAYDGCHGWPYSAGKSWSYNVTIVDALGTTVTAAHAMVTAGPGPFPPSPYVDVYTITHFLSWADIPNTTFMQQYWSDTARNFVYQWDAGTFDVPPLDIRALIGSSIAAVPAPACCNATSWLSFDKVSGGLLASQSEVLTVTANTSGLAVGIHNGTFCISTCCCAGVVHECVDVVLNVLPATSVDVIRDLPPDAMDFDAEYPGDTFWVNITFTAPTNGFNSIGLTDYAPAGWEVETNVAWCTPVASWTMSPGNKAEYAWAGPYTVGQNFTASYRVTIPATADPGSSFWPDCTPLPCCEGSPITHYEVWLEYWFGPEGPFDSCITGEREKIVTVPGCVVGETRDVVGNVLDTVMVNLLETPAIWEDQDSSSIVGTIAVYENCADDTGMYYQKASKYCYFPLNTRPIADGGDMPPVRNPAYPDYIDWSTPELLAAGNVTNFVGDYGLVCKAASLSYAMEAVNHMLFVPLGDDGVTPEPDWQLSNWKAMQVVASWQFPAGCACC